MYTKKAQLDYEQTKAWLEKVVIQGDAFYQNKLGEMYFKSLGVKQDYGQAKVWFEKAALQGYDEAQYNLGVMYEDGRGVHKNYRKAKELYAQSCDNGYQIGCNSYQILDDTCL